MAEMPDLLGCEYMFLIDTPGATTEARCAAGIVKQVENMVIEMRATLGATSSEATG